MYRITKYRQIGPYPWKEGFLVYQYHFLIQTHRNQFPPHIHRCSWYLSSGNKSILHEPQNANPENYLRRASLSGQGEYSLRALWVSKGDWALVDGKEQTLPNPWNSHALLVFYLGARYSGQQDGVGHTLLQGVGQHNANLHVGDLHICWSCLFNS